MSKLKEQILILRSDNKSYNEGAFIFKTKNIMVIGVLILGTLVALDSLAIIEYFIDKK